MCEGDGLKNQAEAFEEMISEAKPDTIFFGAKQKVTTLIEEVSDKPSLSSAPLKNVTEWNCELCEEKKHKRKEATFREQKKDNKNWSIGLFPKKSKFIQLVERPCDDMISGKKSEEGSSSPNNNDPPSLLIDDSADDMRKNVDHEKQNIRGFTFWCDTCKIGTFAVTVMKAHKIGKKTQTQRGEQKLQRRSFTNETTIHPAYGTSFR
ncbi:hypothetical protein KY290_025983 [Solanum tuberosum]|uniref:Uncharacterized protein n=1 Tax=Solanum tuberosum TaxID=4113 RepID=A0ABQ7UWA2_SOLTU|nr:hypothetical protein KY290_025983 [Solanum tuberosum]